MPDRNKNITIWYKIFTKIKDLNYDGSNITGKLLDEKNETLVKQGYICPTCTNISSTRDVNRNVTLEYYNSSTSMWQTITTVDTLDDGSFLHTWTCPAGTTKIRASYTPLNWYYANTSNETSMTC
jgi:hypothetical protein